MCFCPLYCVRVQGAWVQGEVARTFLQVYDRPQGSQREILIGHTPWASPKVGSQAVTARRLFFFNKYLLNFLQFTTYRTHFYCKVTLIVSYIYLCVFDFLTVWKLFILRLLIV